MWKAVLGSDELGYLAQQISKQNFEVMAWFFSLPIAKHERDKLNEELLSKMEQRLDDLGLYQPFQTEKDAKMFTLTVKKVRSGEEDQSVAG